ncbi:hypothetical protein BSK56_00055 [Paenibacillus borealis]|uniref:DUF3139 domain-containing protein n=1 Tax=Paenibacillus borealis TaxID=160799 RepID=A0ABX3HRH3_PAEBO|nr:DUF3139 domain-containing protein [Paenibacillus borealis]OMD53579.1 hypothetical protein BSK56_00055 [Paenibacillus borealis]
MRKFAYRALVMLILLVILTAVVYVQVNKFIFSHRVKAYLIEEKGYSDETISSVKGVWGIKAPPFFAVVSFSDEPEVEYTYFAHNEVMQFSHEISLKGRKSGIRESSLKHIEPYNPY